MMGRSVAFRLVGGILAVVAVAAGSGAFVMMQYGRSVSSLERAITVLGSAQTGASNLLVGIWQMSANVRGHLISPDQGYLDEYHVGSNFAADAARTLSALDLMDADALAVEEIAGLLKQYEDIALSAFSLSKDGRETQAAALVGSNEAAILRQLDAKSKALGQRIYGQVNTLVSDEVSGSRDSMKIGWTALGAAAILGVAAGLVLSLSITRPVKRLANAADRVAGGDLTVESIGSRGHDELARLAGAFDGMLRGLREIVAKASESARQVASSSEELSAAVEQMRNALGQISGTAQEVAGQTSSQAEEARKTTTVLDDLGKVIERVASGAREQTKSLSVATQNVNAMVAAVDQISTSSQGMAVATGKTDLSAASGREAVAKTVVGMQAINDASKQIHVNLSNLTGNSQRIAEIVQVIDEIAGQTNLLALNAAIEAARAGEHGRGFAVVADEVRRLADRSSKSAREIAEIIDDIQAGMSATVNSVNEASAAIEEGMGVADEARRLLEEIESGVKAAGAQFARVKTGVDAVQAASREALRSVDASAAIVEESTAAAEQMSASSSQVLASAGQISRAAERNAASIEEVAAAAEQVNSSIDEMANSAQSLASMAQELSSIVSAFRS